MHGKAASRIIALSLIVASALVPASANAGIFLKAGDIKGDATVAAFKDQIEVATLQFGVTQAAERVGAGGGAGKASFTDVTITKHADSSSPRFATSAASGQVIPAMTISVTRSDARGETVVAEFTLTSVVVSGYTYADPGTGVGNESITLRCSKLQWKYTVPGKTPIQGGWDIVTNRAA